METPNWAYLILFPSPLDIINNLFTKDKRTGNSASLRSKLEYLLIYQFTKRIKTHYELDARRQIPSDRIMCILYAVY